MDGRCVVDLFESYNHYQALKSITRREIHYNIRQAGNESLSKAIVWLITRIYSSGSAGCRHSGLISCESVDIAISMGRLLYSLSS